MLVLDELKEAFYRCGRRRQRCSRGLSKLQRRRVLRARRRRRGELHFSRRTSSDAQSLEGTSRRRQGARTLRRRLTKMLQSPRAAPTNSPSQLQSFITMVTSASSDFAKLTSAFATSVVAVATSAWNFISSKAPVPREVRRRVTSRRCRRRTRALLRSTAVRKPNDCFFAALAVAAQRANDKSLLAVLRKPADVRATLRLGRFEALTARDVLHFAILINRPIVLVHKRGCRAFGTTRVFFGCLSLF